jgi:hypothetical protein
MARQASELRPAVPFLGLAPFEDALEGIRLAVTVNDTSVDQGDTRTIQLDRDAFLDARYAFVVDRDRIARSVERGLRNMRLPDDSVGLLAFATSVTLKQTQPLYPGRDDGRVLLQAIDGPESLPDQIPIPVAANPKLFHDVSGSIQFTYGFVLIRDVDPADALTPRWRGTWLARGWERVRAKRVRTGSYEIHELTEARRRQFGLVGRPLYYVRQVDDAQSPLDARYLDEVIEIFVDDDVLPLLRSERPGAATRYVASQIASQVYVSVLELAVRDLGDDEPEPAHGSVFATALRHLAGRGHKPGLDELRQWVESDPGRLPAWVQARIDQVGAAEVLLAS